MEVILDGQSNYAVQGEPEDVFAVVASISDHLHEQGRVILSVKVDGQSIMPADMVQKLEGAATDEVRVIEVESAAIADLVNTCLKELAEVLPELPKACQAMSEVFQGEAPEAGFEPFQQLADIWHNVKSRELQVINALGLDEDVLAVDGAPLAQTQEELNGYLAEAAEALEAGDFVSLGDLLAYELAPRAEKEEQIVAMLQQHAREYAG